MRLIAVQEIKYKNCHKVSLKRLAQYISLSFLLFPPFFTVHAQQERVSYKEKHSYNIRWVEEFPSGEKRQNKGLGEKITEIIFGKKNIELSKPLLVIAENPNNFLVLDQGLGTLVQGIEGICEIPVALRNENMFYPSLAGLCFYRDNQLLFTDSRQNKIYMLSADQKELSVLNDKLSLDQPTGIAWSESNREIWVVETAAHRISILNYEGELIRSIGSRGSAEGEFNFPTFIWIDSKGNVYIVDSMNFRLQIFNEKGEFVSSFGEIGDASGYFARPKGVAVDSFGHIYIADALYHVVQVYDREGKLLSYFGSQGHGEEQFWMPGGIFIDKDDFIYVADTYNSRIQIFQLVDETLK